MAKVALLIGVSEYEPGLTPLPAAVRDVEALQRVLRDPELGGFDTVKTLINPDPGAMQLAIETLVTEQCSRNDLVLLYFSGHGVRDDSGNLYFATRITCKNTKGDLMRTTAVPARTVDEILHSSRIKRQAIILDCCYSGAFDPALRLKDGGSVDLREQLGAEGRVVLTSSDSTQYSRVEAGADLSLYTHYLVEGIETGAGDLNEDGQISAQELHKYTFDRVRAAAPNMTPKLITLKDLGFDIVLSKAKVTDPRLRYRKTVARHADGETLRPSGRAVLDTLRQQLNLTVPETEEIEAEVFQPYRERLANIQKYRATLRLEAEHQYPLDEAARDAMETLRQLLGLRAEDVVSVEQEIQTEFVPLAEQPIPEPQQEQTPQSVETDFTDNPTSLIADDLFNRGCAKHGQNDKEGAIADFDEAIRLKPDSAKFYYIRGFVKSTLPDYRGAILDINEAIRLEPNSDYSSHAYLTRGGAQYELGDKIRAIIDLDQAIHLKPDNSIAYYYRGLAKADLGDNTGAVLDYDEAIRLEPNNATIYIKRGAAKCVLGNNTAALADFNEAIRLRPDLASAYYLRALVKSALGDKDGARVDYEKTVDLEPDNASVYLFRGRVFFNIGNQTGGKSLKEKALADFNEAICLEPTCADAYYNRGLAKADLGDKQGAMADYQYAAQLYQQQGDMESYRNTLKAILQLEKKGKGFLGGLFS